MNRSEKDPSGEEEEVVIMNRKEYSICEKILCCRCFSFFQHNSILTSNIRKRTLQKLLDTYILDESDEEVLYDPVKLMILIYLCEDQAIPHRHINKCRICPSVGVSNYRTDLEFYIPQLCNFIVYHGDMKNSYLLSSIEGMCRLSLYFAQLFYFYMCSIEKSVKKEEIQIIHPVVEYNINFLKEMAKIYNHASSITCLDVYEKQYFKETIPSEHHSNYKLIKEYGALSMGEKWQQNNEIVRVKVQDIDLPPYRSVFGDKTDKKASAFTSNLQFFNDLFLISEDLKNHQNKKLKVNEGLAEINKQLPAAVYVPFSKNSYRLCNILKIVLSETRVFSTKERAPYCICVEIFCPAEKLSLPIQQKFWDSVQAPFTLKYNNKTEKKLFKLQEQFISKESHHSRSLKKNSLNRNSRLSEHKERKSSNILERLIKEHDNYYVRDIYSQSIDTEVHSSGEESIRKKSIINFEAQDLEKKKGHQLKANLLENPEKYEKIFSKMFGQPLLDSKVRISKNSIFGNFFSWDCLYFIIKTKDDLKQEQFALQLIYQFDYIFKLEKLPLILTPYEVLSMGPDSGIIEMVKDSVTFDSLKKTLRKQFQKEVSLKQFFEIYFKEDLDQAKDNFMKSLAAYCVVMYVLQAKDRHNGNIMLHRNGKMFHIDFGFFLSNLPGKGIQLEKDCPFKFLSEYIEVLDGLESYYFKRFRQYFFLGFKAVKKHQDKILTLVKMMYSSGGMTMPCFEKGEFAIKAIENRINPEDAINDPLLNIHCQKLINLSVDNWAAKWYDRFQYWAQGIFY